MGRLVQSTTGSTRSTRRSIPAGTRELNGSEALAYVRYREAVTADIGRVARYLTNGFDKGLTLVNAIGAAAEEMNHHPDIDIRWDTVTLVLSTHSEGGLTAADFELAGRIARLIEP